jgi:hypothetical protein
MSETASLDAKVIALYSESHVHGSFLAKADDDAPATALWVL